MKPVIAALCYGELSSLIESKSYLFQEFVEIRIVNSLLNDAIKIARKMEDERTADVFVCSGNSFLSKYLTSPFVEIRATGFDLLFAFKKAKEFSDQVAIVMHYHNKIQYIDEVSDLFSIKIKQVTYDNNDKIAEILNNLAAEGFNNVIGPGFVVELAQRLGINSTLIYSEDAVITALKTAVSIALSKKAESELAERFRIIMDFTHEGIVATDKNGKITVINPAAERILNKTRKESIGRPVQELFSNSKLFEVIQNGKAQINQVQTIGDAKIVSNVIPFVVNNELAGAVSTFQNIGTIQEAEEKIRKKIYEKGLFAKTSLDDIVGCSENITESKRQALLYAKSDSTLLITGESGTGKELFAQGIHNASHRAKQPFVAINCQALPENLLESELFGYEDGAFTGAKKGGKLGFFELAHGGTIFLDEIGEIPPMLQSRLLRVLEEREVMRIGGSKVLPVNIRVVAATNVNLYRMLSQGKFREDLYYRLNVLELDIPPLRVRKKDIPLLVVKFFHEYRNDLNDDEIIRISKSPIFCAYDWPGNIRELKNIIERFAVLYARDNDASTLLESIFKKQIECSAAANEELQEIYRVLNEVRGNKTEAAKRLGVSRTTLWKKLKSYQVKQYERLLTDS